MKTVPVIPVIIDRHAEDAAFLWLLRDAAVAAPNYSLDDLAELDNRLDAHLDGLRVAGEAGWEVCKAALEIGEPGEFFTAAFLAFDSSDGGRIDEVLSAAQGSRENLAAVVSALGWHEFTHIEPLASVFCNANQAIYNYLGLSAFAIHRADPGPALERFLSSDNPMIRARSLKAVGELQRHDLLPLLPDYWEAADEASRFWSVWSAVLLGNREAALRLKIFVGPDSSYAEAALNLLARVLDGESARNWLSGLARQEDKRRYALIGAGLSGDPLYIHSLLNQMADPAHARVAGEGFSMITGADLAYLDLDADWPDDFEAGPTEDPEDENVEMDADEDLPWPSPGAISQWWSANQHRFSTGQRYLCGEPISLPQCQAVLKDGYQRQRRAAALELVLSGGGGTLYETRAPGFRQKKAMARKGAGR